MKDTHDRRAYVAPVLVEHGSLQSCTLQSETITKPETDLDLWEHPLAY